jgi:hypothetical protein
MGTEFVPDTNVEFSDTANTDGSFDLINNTTWFHAVDEDFDISGLPSEMLVMGPGPSITDPVSNGVDAQGSKYQAEHTTYELTKVFTDVKSSKITYPLIPYMRAVTLKYIVTGLKRNSNINVYIDKIDLATHITPSTELTVSVTSGTFDAKSVVGSEDEDIRKVSGNKVTALNIGDVITGGTSSATAVLLGIEKTTGSNIILFVSNVKGTFAASEVITGSISGAIATISTLTTPTIAKSSSRGNLYGLLALPNEGDKKLLCGKKEIIFTTSLLSDIFSESFAIASFHSSGTLEQTQPMVTNTESWMNMPIASNNSESDTTQVSGDDTLVNREGEEIVIGLQWHSQWVSPIDPLCQTFFVEDDTGIFVTSIDLYFGQKDTSDIPLYVSIVETINGYPGPKSAANSMVYVDASDINVDTVNTTTIDSRPYGNPIPTNIKFPAPVYLEGGKEYGIYIRSDSQKYYLWLSYMGDDDIISGGSIQTQPLLGSLFKSQSASAWTTDQYEDLTFKLYRAEFDTGIGTFNLVNDNLPDNDVSHLFGRTKTGSSLIRISLPNNGLNNGDSVVISGLETGTYAGINATAINGTHTVSNVQNNFFIIDVGVTATSSEYLRQKFGLQITKNIKADSLQPAFKDKIIPGTNLEYEYKKYNDTSYTKLVNRLSKSTESTISILNPVGETTQYSGNSSLEFKATLTTTDARVSPRINTAGIDVLCAANIINLPDISNINTALDVGSFTSGTLTNSSAGNIISTADAATILEFGKFKIGMNLNIYDGTSGGTDLGNFIITDISDDKTTVTVDSAFTMTGTTLYIEYNTRYLDEITPMGSTSVSKYVSRPLQFVNISTGFKLFFTYNQPYNTNIDFYYRTSNSGVEGVIHKKLKYTKIDNIGTKSSNNKNGFFEGAVTVTGADDYDVISVKIVFNSGDSNKTPRLRDFRIVAVA